MALTSDQRALFEEFVQEMTVAATVLGEVGAAQTLQEFTMKTAAQRLAAFKVWAVDLHDNIESDRTQIQVASTRQRAELSARKVKLAMVASVVRL